MWTSEIEDKLRADNYQSKQITDYVKNCTKCDYAAVININSETFSCITCDKVTCPKCDKPAHIGISCAENQIKMNEQQTANKDQNDQIMESGDNIVKCPKCGSYCELFEGCQFMTCLSSFCLKKTHFCNLCGKQLTAKGHWGHYSLKGPYGDTCNTVDKIEDAPDVSIPGTEMPNFRGSFKAKKIKKEEEQIPIDNPMQEQI